VVGVALVATPPRCATQLYTVLKGRKIVAQGARRCEKACKGAKTRLQESLCLLRDLKDLASLRELFLAHQEALAIVAG